MTLKQSLGRGMAGFSRARWNIRTSLRVAILGALLYSAGAASPALSVTRYTYDDLNRLIHVAYDDKGSVIGITDALNHTFQFTYDPYNNLASVKDPTQAVTTFTHDVLGNLLSRTDPAGNTAHFTYDALGELTRSSIRVTDLQGKTSLLETALEYDANGNCTLITDPLSRITRYAYNSTGKLTQREDARGGVTAVEYGSSGCSTCNGAGEKLTALTDPMGSKTTFTYDLRGLETVSTDPLGRKSTLAYNSMGRLTRRTDRNALGTSYAYDAAGNLTRITYPDGTTISYTYDKLNRLSRVTLTTATGTVRQASYTYDTAGNLRSFTHFNGIKALYTHDEAGRLLAVTEAGVSSYRFTLDAAGNRTRIAATEPLSPSFSAGSLSYTYDARHRRLVFAGSTSYLYDREGQLASAGATAYTFDHAHRLSGIGSSTRFSYDGKGNRLQAKRGAATTRYIHDPWGNLIAEADGSNQITRAYVHGLGLVSMVTSSGAIYCYHYDGTGSTVALTNMSKALVNRYAYDPFGRLTQKEAISQPFKFVGRYGVMAEANGLYYMRARYYDCRVGRFISEDPIGFAGGDTNFYAYVRNDPVNRIDPWGEQDITVEIDSMSGLPYFKRTVPVIEHQPRLGGGGGGSGKCAAKGGVERIAGSRLSHINGAIGEAHGWNNALEAGHIGIQSPRKVTAPGADFITYNPQTQNIVVWDAKYRGPGGSYPSSFPAAKLQKWMPEVVEAVKNMAPGPAKTAAERALESGKVIGQLVGWP